MARRRKGDESEGGESPGAGTAVTDLPAAGHTPDGKPAGEPPVQPAAHGNGPAASFAAQSDRTTRLEVAVWARPVKVSETEEYTRYSLTVKRLWPDTDGGWRETAFYRAHDVPVLLFLVRQAYDWCLAKRTTVKIGPDGEMPF